MLNYQGIIIGASAFLIIGIFHPIVIKGEYHFGKRIWPIFLVSGILFIGVSLFVNQEIISPIIAVTGFTCLWSIHEIIEQEERVKRGWFPSNPNKVNKVDVEKSVRK